MEAAVERRSAKGSRIPLDVLVELTHEDYEEAFEADGVNLSVGGLSMRAPYLPDVGARLRCRFEHPPSGERVEADAEVVWAQDTGTHTGEFGLRFVELGEGAERTIRRMVGTAYLPPPPSAEDTIDEQPPSTVELQLDGVGSPIVARVIHSDGEGMAVEQELPFLRLRTGITTPDGRRGRIEAVDLAVDGDTPKLLLDVSYDERSFVVPEADATIPDFFPTSSPDTPDEGIDAGAEPAPEHEPEPRVVVAQAAPEAREPSQVFVTTSREEHERELAARASARAEAEAEAEPETARSTGAIARVRSSLAPAASRVAPAVGKIRAKSVALLAKLGPWWVALVAWSKRAAKAVAGRSGPWALSAWSAVRRTGGRSLYVVRERIGRRFPRLAPAEARRRTTSPPPRASNVTRPLRKQKRDAAVTVAARSRGRTLAVALVAAAAVAFAVYAFLPAGEPAAEGRIEVHREIAPEPATVDPEQGDTQATDVPASAPAAPAAAPAPVEPTMPTAMRDPSREAGPMPPPTFPSLREGARPQAPEGLPEGSPYAVDVREGGTVQTETTTSPTSFGSGSVPDGRSFLIRMSRPVEAIEGTRLTDGFRVRIPGSLSLDRAGPIASSHPFVERSMILNRGDHAELTIRFVEGRTPTYRVSARGSAIEVLIAQR